MEMPLLIGILLAALVLLISQVVRIEVTALLLVSVLALTGILTPGEALAGFSHQATVTVAAMFVLSAALARTGALDSLAILVARLCAGRPALLLPAVGLLAALPSAVLNNTAIVVMLVPVVLDLCRRNELAPSKLMIPLSYFAILGGTLTVVGTSTNILVDSLYRKTGGPGFGMFEFSSMGLAYLALGGLFLWLFAGRLLPERTVLSQLLEPRQRSNFVTEITLPEDSRHAGMTLGEVVGNAEDVRVLEVLRDEEVILGPPPALPLAAGDSLLIEGSPRSLHRVLESQGLDLGSAVADRQRVKISRVDLLTVEAVITPNSPFVEQRLSEIGLNRHYGVKVLAVQRLGRHHRMRLRGMRLQVGDVLLVQGEQRSLHELQASGAVLLIEGVERTLRDPAKTPLAIAILAAAVGLAALGWQPISVLAVAACALMILTGCLRLKEAFDSLETSVLLLIAGTIPLGTAMAKTGLAEDLARGVLSLTEGSSPVLLIAAFYLLTSFLTEVLSNNAAAVLLTPIALELAREAGIDPKPLLVALTFGASASFATPIGYQTNTLVMGPGGYRFIDYLRIGLPLNLLLWLAACLLIPVFWPL